MKLTIVTSNLGKVKEFQNAFDDLGIELVHKHIEYDEVQSSDLEEVVAKGLKYLKEAGLSDFIIDDSGIFINSLKGFPGVWSAYVQNTIGNTGILKLMEDAEDRNAEFRCCIGCNISGKDIIVTGKCEGIILKKECGNDGFGFDPIFSPDGRRSFSEITVDEKNLISHRGNAIKMLITEIKRSLGSDNKP